VKLDQQKGWKTPGKVIARSTAPRSNVIQTPFGVVHRNRRHLHTMTSPGRFKMPDEQRFGSRARVTSRRTRLGISTCGTRRTAADFETLQSDAGCTLLCKHTVQFTSTKS